MRRLASLLVVLWLTLWGTSAWAAIAFDAVSNSPDNETSNTTTWSHTAAGDFMLVCAQARSVVEAEVAVSSITYNGVSLTKIRDDRYYNGSGTYFQTEQWYLPLPASGAHSVVITWAGTPVDFGVGTATTFSGVDLAAPVDAQNGGSGNGTTLSAIVTTVTANAWLADCAIGADTAGLTVGGGQTMRTDRVVGVTEATNDGVGISTVNGKASPGAETMDWTQASSSDWVMSAVALKPFIAIVPVGTQFNGTCGTISWTANTETDLEGYKLYDQISLTSPFTLKATFGPQITSVSCSTLNFNAGQHYVSLTAFDTSGNESAHSTLLPFFLVTDNQVSNLRVTATTSTSLTLTFTEVQDGTGAAAKYDVRFATPTINWGSAASVTAGTCTTPVAGTTVGASKSCTITGLTNATQYQVQLVPYRGTLGQGAIFGPLSNVATGTTGALPIGGRTILTQDLFTRGDASTLGGDWVNIAGSSWQIVSNHARAALDGETLANNAHKADLPNDQFADVVLTTFAGAQELYQGLQLRASVTEDTSYTFLAYRNSGGTSGSIISWRVNGVTQGNLASNATTTWVNGDVMRVEAVGTSLCLYRNDVQDLCTTHSALSGSHAGLWMYHVSGVAIDSEMDTFHAGSFDRVTFVSDEFTRGNQTGLGNNWQIIGSAPWAISSNIAQPPAAGPLHAVETHNTVLPARQWAQTTIAAIGGSDYLWEGLTLRSDIASESGYQFLASVGPSAGSTISVRLNGIYLSSPGYDPATVWAAGDWLRAEAEDATVRLYRNGILTLTVDDAQFAAGYAGLWGYLNSGAATNMQLDSFSAGTWLAGTGDICGCDNH
jgi:hypothetical protein